MSNRWLLALTLLSACDSTEGGFAVVSVTPSDGTIDVPLDASVVVEVTEGAQLDVATVHDGSVYLFDPVSEMKIVGTYAVDGPTITFQPQAPLHRATTYQGTVTTPLAASDGTLVGETFRWSFATPLNLGQFDDDFGNQGSVTTDHFSDTWTSGRAVTGLPDGRFIVGGYAYVHLSDAGHP